MSTDGFSDLLLRIEDPVALITLNRPATLNSFTHDTLAQLRRAVDLAADDPAVVGIVITGAGRGFCSGLDSSALTAAAAQGADARVDPGDDLPGFFSWLVDVDKPVVAAVNGVAAGGGLALAAMCDLRFASPAASFTTTFSRRGLVAEHGTSWNLSRLVGLGNALDLLWSARRIDAAEAYRTGLVEHLVDDGDVVSAACAYVEQLAREVSPSSLRDIKRLVYRHAGTHYTSALHEADDWQWRSLDRVDALEGAESLVEKRPPQFPRLGPGGSPIAWPPTDREEP